MTIYTVAIEAHVFENSAIININISLVVFMLLTDIFE